MSIIEAHVRPWTKFDPKNKVHRAYYTEFLRTQSWGHCPYRFFVEDEGGNLIGYIQRVLLEHYTDKEFGSSTGVERTHPVERIVLDTTMDLTLKPPRFQPVTVPSLANKETL